MTYDYLQLDERSAVPLYQQLASRIRAAADSGRLKKGDKLPSIRKLSDDLGLSRTTVETAYQQLCVEGYVKSKPQSGYFVEASAGKGEREKGGLDIPAAPAPAGRVRYDFGSGYVDRKNNCVKAWRRHIRDALNRQEAILSYGEPQGERALREALSAYSYGVRGVEAAPEQIVIGAGTQPLLYLLCGLLDKKRVALGEEGFEQAERVFADCGIQTVRIPSDNDGFCVEALRQSGVDAALVHPSRAVRSGNAMPTSRRFALMEWAEQGGLLIEDDYNGELRYQARPISSVQGMAHGRGVVYLGSFSKLLLPSVRIGYMVLPAPLLARYQARAGAYNQTASKIEQLALSGYLKSGQLERSLRKMRKLYAAKSALLQKEIRRAFGDTFSLLLQETALCLYLIPTSGQNAETLRSAAAEAGVALRTSKDGSAAALYFGGIALEDIPAAVSLLREAWRGS